MITAKKFYMIRHGQSTANKAEYMSGQVDVPLTDLGREQAEKARAQVKALDTPPVQIVHSRLQRARNTAEIINKNLKLPMSETPLLNEIDFGDWEKRPINEVRNRFYDGENPPNGESHDVFATRVRKGVNWALEKDGPVLIACHGGVFRGFNHIYQKKIMPIENCILYEFTPDNTDPTFPWLVTACG